MTVLRLPARLVDELRTELLQSDGQERFAFLYAGQQGDLLGSAAVPVADEQMANHDSAPPELEELARAFILTYEGYPRVYNYLIDFDDPDLQNLLWIRGNLLGGSAITRYVDEDLIIFEREDNAIVALNKGWGDRSEWVNVPWTDEPLEEYTGNATDTEANSDGWAEITAPAGGWAVYAPEDAAGDGGNGGDNGGDNGDDDDDTDDELEGTYALRANHSDKAIDVEDISTDDGANVHQWEYLEGDNQHWEVEALGDGEYRLTVQHSGNVLAADGTEDGDNVQQEEWSDNANQRWTFDDVGDGYAIENAASGRALDVDGISTDDGANVHQWEYVGGDNQTWTLDPV